MDHEGWDELFKAVLEQAKRVDALEARVAELEAREETYRRPVLVLAEQATEAAGGRA